ncbi:MAG: DUF1841 family protein [Gammaproteobacteria bacterium]|nr:DUF1841 family protein [Gammaproteobacteria bacterium]
MFPQDRTELRAYYFSAWEKYRQKLPMEPLEIQITDVIAMHPEYHAIVENPEPGEQDFPVDDGQTNPFLHMGLHLAIREQLTTDRPTGFAQLYQKIARKAGDPHQAEHQIMEHLAESLWLSQKQGLPPDEAVYLDQLRRLAGNA